MSLSDLPCLSLAIARLSTTGKDNFAVWVLKAPYPSGYVFHDRILPPTLTQSWQAWQAMFAPHASNQSASEQIFAALALAPELIVTPGGKTNNQSSRLMQHLGISLWRWLFQGAIQSSLETSQGIALGQDKPLRLRLEIREPDLIALPWEIMQSQPGKPAISLSGQVLFSRTTSDVDPLPPLPSNQGLKILLVLGQNSFCESLQLEKEAKMLEQTLQSFQQVKPINEKNLAKVQCQVDTLLQPTPKQLISQLETQAYNIFFYAGHGLSAPDGGLLFLRPDMALNGTELAQVLTRSQVRLCVINACWGAQPAFEQQQALPRSSLAEVLIHHGVPAVLGMRDEIADEEALSFIQAFTQALAAGTPIDQAMAIARQQLLTLYKFNYPAWTLPVLYMHPEFNGELFSYLDRGITQLPEDTISGMGQPRLTVALRSLSTPEQVWQWRHSLVRVGRLAENDIVITEPWVSQRHAEIFCRQAHCGDTIYFLRDNSRYGTLLSDSDQWQNIHLQEVPLQSGMRLKFGSSKGQAFEFIVEG
jgi:hypothetical protein